MFSRLISPFGANFLGQLSKQLLIFVCKYRYSPQHITEMVMSNVLLSWALSAGKLIRHSWSFWNLCAGYVVAVSSPTHGATFVTKVQPLQSSEGGSFEPKPAGHCLPPSLPSAFSVFSKPFAWEVPCWAEESNDHCSGDVDSVYHCLLTHKEVWGARAISNFPLRSCRSVDRHGEWFRNCWSGNGLFCYS